jgi:hypothetical protein
MQKGAVALIDALGFRGIWNRYPPEAVLSEMKSVKNWFEDKISEQFKMQHDFNCNVAFLSDTIAVSMAYNGGPDEHREALCVIFLGNVISWVLHRVLKSEIPFAYRGAIAIGEYEVSQHFLIGQAIDDAASAHELAQGAIIWLTPGARESVAEWLGLRPGTGSHMVNFDVPLKGGDTFTTYTLSPLEQARDFNDAELITHNLLATFSIQSVDVAVKRQNTIRHMCACYRARGFEPSSQLTPM